MGSQEDYHALDGKRVNSPVNEIYCQLDIIIEIILALVGVRYDPHVREGTLHKPIGATNSINSEILVLGVIE